MSDRFHRRALILLASLGHACVCNECVCKVAATLRRTYKADVRSLQKKYQFVPGLEL